MIEVQKWLDEFEEWLVPFLDEDEHLCPEIIAERLQELRSVLLDNEIEM